MSDRHTFQIDSADAGRRLDEFLASRFGTLSRIRIARLVGEGACLLNDVRAESGQRVRAGDVIVFDVTDFGPSAMTPESIPLTVFYEDDHIMVVDKPSGMLVHPTVGVKTGTLANALTYHLNREILEGDTVVRCDDDTRTAIQTQLIRPGIVHRLDRATSGLMVVAKDQRALGVLSRHFRKRLTEKRYVALVHGDMGSDSGTIQAPIGRDPDKRPQWGVVASGKAAETCYQVTERFSAATLVELEPVTGRTNQLRIHCAHIGHAIVGDEYYGGLEPNVVISGDRSSQSKRSFELPGRLFLHAAWLAFKHPRTGAWLEFTSPLPGELEQCLAQLRTC